MALPEIPELPFKLPDPASYLQAIIPDRIIPTLIPVLSSYAARVTVETHAFGEVPAATLETKLIANSMSPEGDLHEFYVLMRNGDPEAFMDLVEKEETVECSISRMCSAAIDIFVDEELKASFPEATGAGPWIGYALFGIPKES